MVNKARPLLFSTPHPPSVTASCIAAIDVLEKDDSLIQKLWYNTRYFKAGMKSIGLPIQSETPICPVIVGSSENAQKLSQRLFDEGIFGRAIVFPTVAADKARVRIMINATHTQAHLDRCIETFEKFDFSFEIGRLLYGDDHWVFEWTMLLALKEPGGAPFTARVEMLDVVTVNARGEVTRKDVYMNGAESQAAFVRAGIQR